MKLLIEKWLDEHKLPDAAEPLLLDAVICYKSGAYRASLLMSYLGFFVTIKHRILTGNKPTLLPQHKWTDKLNRLRNEDEWEAEVFSALQKKEVTTGAGSSRTRTEDPFFPITDGIRQQVIYWKDRRNDCAHNKDNIIIAGHIEAFWSFLMSNLSKMTLEGGMASLLLKLDAFYDPNQTAAGTPLAPIVAKIHSSVEPTELMSFWAEAFNVVGGANDWTHELRNDFIFEVMRSSVTAIKESLLEFLKRDEPKLLSYIDKHPEVVQMLDFSEQEIRSFWKTKVRQRNNPLKIYASLLRNDLIPEAEIEEANNFFSEKLEYTKDGLDRDVLNQHSFDKALYKRLFVEPDRSYWKFWETLNSTATGYVQYVEFLPLTEEIVKFISEELSKEYFSYYLTQGLENVFQNNASKKQEFKAIAAAASIQLPTKLASLA
ncbi:MAG: hypothetical protein ACO1NU_08465 [Arcticibacter sp.]